MRRLTRLDPAYPVRLRTLKRPPDPLWVDGELPDPDRPTVGIVGTRRLTPYGGRVAAELAATFGRAGAVVVSGLAQGIDSKAHAGALEAGGVTVAVLGEGLAWLAEHGPLPRRALAGKIRERGAVVSEYAPEHAAGEWTFPRRNYTLAALCDALVVVEAPEGSGALITAERMREDLHRPVFVAPGPLGAPTWLGSHRYIASGKGKLLASAQQLAAELGLRLAPDGTPTGDRLAGRLIELLAADAADADAIAAGLEIGSAEATTLIAEMLLAGAIVATGDGRFARR